MYKNYSSSALKAILREDRKGNGKKLHKDDKEDIQAILKSRKNW